jgi:hypothetical protein
MKRPRGSAGGWLGRAARGPHEWSPTPPGPGSRSGARLHAMRSRILRKTEGRNPRRASARAPVRGPVSIDPEGRRPSGSRIVGDPFAEAADSGQHRGPPFRVLRRRHPQRRRARVLIPAKPGNQSSGGIVAESGKGMDGGRRPRAVERPRLTRGRRSSGCGTSPPTLARPGARRPSRVAAISAELGEASRQGRPRRGPDMFLGIHTLRGIHLKGEGGNRSHPFRRRPWRGCRSAVSIRPSSAHHQGPRSERGRTTPRPGKIGPESPGRDVQHLLNLRR